MFFSVMKTDLYCWFSMLAILLDHFHMYLLFVMVQFYLQIFCTYLYFCRILGGCFWLLLLLSCFLISFCLFPWHKFCISLCNPSIFFNFCCLSKVQINCFSDCAYSAIYSLFNLIIMSSCCMVLPCQCKGMLAFLAVSIRTFVKLSLAFSIFCIPPKIWFQFLLFKSVLIWIWSIVEMYFKISGVLLFLKSLCSPLMLLICYCEMDVILIDRQSVKFCTWNVNI